jgi:hypothetical protein
MEWIEKGIIYKNRINAAEYQMNFLEEKHLNSVMVLQDIIISKLNDRTIFNRFSSEFIQKLINDQGKMIGIFVEDELIACHALCFPKPDDLNNNLGRDIELPEEQVINCVNFQGVFVHPEYRGNRLGLKMNQKMIEILRNKPYRHALATVSPHNIISVDMFFKSGFNIRGLKYKYENKMRYIFYKDIRSDSEKVFYYRTILLNSEIEKQQAILKKGYWGIELRNKNGNECEIVYGSRNADY